MMEPRNDEERAKQAAGQAAANVVEDGMVLGFGTGSTVAWFLQALARRNLDVHGVATSVETEEEGAALGLDIRSVEEIARVDLVVDGADELTHDLTLTKGGGGALLREKVVAEMADEMLVIATPDKVVDRLGESFPLPVDVVPFAVAPITRRLRARGWDVSRRNSMTDNGTQVLDARVPGGIDDPRAEAVTLSTMAGIAEHGLFIDLATAAVLGSPDGSVQWIGSLGA
jgi:ribose 5-phosphate isomerase A